MIVDQGRRLRQAAAQQQLRGAREVASRTRPARASPTPIAAALRIPSAHIVMDVRQHHRPQRHGSNQ